MYCLIVVRRARQGARKVAGLVRRVGSGAGSQARPGVLGHELRAGQGIIHRNPPHRAVEFDSQRAGRIPNRSKPADIFRVEPAWSQWRDLV